MSLSHIFNDKLYKARKENDMILAVTSGEVSQYTFFATNYYDFGQRQLVTSVRGGGGVTPFSQVDRDVLETMHAKLVELGGHPPPLPAAETVVVERKPKGLGL